MWNEGTKTMRNDRTKSEKNWTGSFAHVSLLSDRHSIQIEAVEKEFFPVRTVEATMNHKRVSTEAVAESRNLPDSCFLLLRTRVPPHLFTSLRPTPCNNAPVKAHNGVSGRRLQAEAQNVTEAEVSWRWHWSPYCCLSIVILGIWPPEFLVSDRMH